EHEGAARNLGVPKVLRQGSGRTRVADLPALGSRLCPMRVPSHGHARRRKRERLPSAEDRLRMHVLVQEREVKEIGLVVSVYRAGRTRLGLFEDAFENLLHVLDRSDLRWELQIPPRVVRDAGR